MFPEQLYETCNQLSLRLRLFFQRLEENFTKIPVFLQEMESGITNTVKTLDRQLHECSRQSETNFGADGKSAYSTIPRHNETFDQGFPTPPSSPLMGKGTQYNVTMVGIQRTRGLDGHFCLHNL